MSPNLFTYGRFGRSMPTQERWIDWAWAGGLLLAAGFLLCFQLGNLPLRDWDEGIVAQVAREIWRSGAALFHDLSAWPAWIYPKDVVGNPYFNKPPLMHWLVALSYGLGGVTEWSTRLPSALLTATSVPLLYWIGREIFYERVPALFAAVIYMTWLPIVRQGRLAMLDGAILCFFLLMMACLLRSRRDLRWSLGIGLGIGLMCFTKGILGLFLGAIGLAFMVWDTPRLLSCGYLWLGLVLGIAPVAGWYGAQWLQYNSQFVGEHLMKQSLNRVWEDVGSNKGPVWYYFLEVLKYGVPWIFFLPQAIGFAWHHRNLSWARLLLLWSGVYFVTISIMSTKLPWYVLPLYPALALLLGAQLSRVWTPPLAVSLQQSIKIPYRNVWASLFGLLMTIAGVGIAYFVTQPNPEWDIVLALGTLGITGLVVTILLFQQDRQFIPVLMWGMYLTLLFFVGSNVWIWELNEAYPVKPIAQMIQTRTPDRATIYTSYFANRPSLNFYSERQVIPADLPTLIQKLQTSDGQEPASYLLVEADVVPKLPAKQAKQLASIEVKTLGKPSTWVLLTQAKG
ncbi:glycosyltransferase family 39 protein [Alkalinema pantanalense CENA528]|uniref:glycosyltransferase family 39 protein n=1 Tax=Alkalinema pantanalense TaxID=1620705 RepID=UPI003D6F5525